MEGGKPQCNEWFPNSKRKIVWCGVGVQKLFWRLLSALNLPREVLYHGARSDGSRFSGAEMYKPQTKKKQTRTLLYRQERRLMQLVTKKEH
jgi:hypothetical protein